MNWAGRREESLSKLPQFCYFSAALFKIIAFSNLVWADGPKVFQYRLKFTSKYKQGAALVNVTITEKLSLLGLLVNVCNATK